MSDYYRGDQRRGVTAPDLMKPCSHVDHIVRARGKRSAFTSVSLDLGKIEIFGEVNYELLKQRLIDGGHNLIEHQELLCSLKAAAQDENGAERVKATQALRYAIRRKEGLVDWKFDITSVARKDIIEWAFRHIQEFFKAV